MNKKTILITGSLGQLGSELKELSEKHDVYHFIFIDIAELDITNEIAVQKFFQDHQIHVCINTAAYTAVDAAESNQELAYKINVNGVRYLASACAQQDVLFMHISTDFVFDGTKSIPYTEEDIPQPLNIYGRTKLDGECAAFGVCKKSIIIRTAWLYSCFGKNFVKTILEKGKERGKLSIVYDQIGTPTYAKDLARALMQIIEMHNTTEQDKKEMLYGIYHYTNEGCASWYDFAQSIIEYSGIACALMPVTTQEYVTPARPAYSILNKKKIRERFGITIPHWRESLKKCLASGESCQKVKNML